MGRFLSTVARAFWAMLPAYVPNNAAVLLGGDRPIDGGRTWGSNRVLGDGKTWRGTLLGTACGLVLALLLNRLRTYVGARRCPDSISSISFSARFRLPHSSRRSGSGACSACRCCSPYSY